MSEVQSPPGYLQQTRPVMLRSPEWVFAINLNSLSYAPRDKRRCNFLRSDNNTMPAKQPMFMQSFSSLVIYFCLSCPCGKRQAFGRPYLLFVILKFLKQLNDCHATWRTHELLRWEQEAHHFTQNPEVLDPRLRTARFVAHSLVCRNVLGFR